MTTTLMETSADTWIQRDPNQFESKVAPVLHASHQGGPQRRIRDYLVRNQLRRAHAENTYRASRHPERGLPVASNPEVVGFIAGLIKQRKVLAVALLVLNVLAAVAGLLVPQILGSIVNRAQAIDSTLAGALTGLAVGVSGIVVIQAVLNFFARRTSTLFGQGMLSAAREYIIRTVLQLPLSRVESASTGDLVTRVTRDVGSMAGAVRWALPQFVIATVTVALTVVALVINSPLLAVPIVIVFALLWLSVRRYLRAAPQGYITEGNSYAQVNTSLTETVEGARTVEALGLQQHRIALTDDDLQVCGQAERYTITLRNELFLGTGLAYQTPLVLVIVLGGWGFAHGWVSLGQITAATIYLQQIVGPIERMIQTLNMLQVGMASTTRLLGIATVPPDREATDEVPANEHMRGSDLRFAYRAGHDVLHGIDFDVLPGERLAVVGPSGSGKSTLGRLLAGINAPRTGEVSVGGVNVMHLPLAQLRTSVALVTQEHHVFVGSIRDNIVLAREDTATDEEVWKALRTVEAASWVQRMPDGLNTLVGSGNQALTPAQAQQVALARLVIADPHTLVLDEATSLIDPHTARHVEGSMAALLADRTVVAIAHRLHTAHDAHRIAVVIDGRIVELGSHQELMALDGEYAALWRAWTR